MISTKVKALVIVFALFLFTGIITAGCKKKSEVAWVNTNSLPGNTFTQHTSTSTSTGDAKRSSSAIVYLGSDSSSSDANFGPRDVSFEFRSLK